MVNDESARERCADEDDTKIERDHVQTRKAEDDARGSANWNEDVILPPSDEEREGRRQKINRE